MTHRSRNEEGWALAIAITLMTIMLTIGLAAFAIVDTQTSESRKQRERDSAFHVAEGVLYAQGFALARNWPLPTSANPTYPVSCSAPSATTPSTVTAAQCPTEGMIAGASETTGANFTNVDASGADTTWTVKVRDNGGQITQIYDPAVADVPQVNAAPVGRCPAVGDGPCTTDANGDNALWVNAQATVRGRTRNIVALMRLEELAEDVPVAAVTSGALDITMSGQQIVIQGNGGTVGVRCTPESPISNGGNGNGNGGGGGSGGQAPVCSGAEAGQVLPGVTQTNTGNLMTHDQLMRFRDRAKIDGRYFPGCPTPGADGKIDLSGAVVFVEGCSATPQLTPGNVKTETCDPAAPSLGGTQQLSQKCINQSGAPGVLIWHCGSLDISGSYNYVGLMYFVNDSDPQYPCSSVPAPSQKGNGKCHGGNFDPANDVLFTTGGFGLWGALAIDGPGCMKVKANGFQVYYDANVFGAVQSYGTVGVEQSTWRELPAPVA